MARLECKNPEEVVKEAFWLAWQACGNPMGMGFLQDRPSATKDDVWRNVRSAGDYKVAPDHDPAKLMGSDKPGEAYGDYVFGRMMKLELKWDATGVEFSGGGPRLDYQSWSRKYPSYTDLIQAAIKSIGGE